MKNPQNNSVCASALKITLAVAVISISAILLASTSKAAPTAVPCRVDTPDAIAVERHTLEAALLTGCPLTAADVVAFGAVNGLDWLAIHRFYLGFTGGVVGRAGTDTGCGLCYGDTTPSTTSALPGVTVSLPTANLDTSVNIATTIILPVITTNIDANSGLVGFQGDFTFDERVVNFPGNAAQQAGLTVQTETGNWQIVGNILPGTGPFRTLRVAGWALYGGFEPLAGSGTLFNLKMRRVSNTPGDTSNLVWISPENFQFVHTSLNLLTPQYNNGVITITGSAPTPTPVPSTPTPPPAPTPTPTPEPSTPTPPPASTPTPPPPGCGRIDIADSVAVLQHLSMSGPPLTGCALSAGDVTGEGSVNTADAIGIQRFYVGLTSGTGVLIGTDTGCGLCHGDPATSTSSPLAGVTVSLPTANLDTSVDISTIIIQPVVTTTIDSSMGLVGFQGDFTFDERVVTFNASQPVVRTGLTSPNGWTVLGHILSGAGPFRTLRVSAWFPDGFTPISGSGTLFNLRMLRVSSTPGDMSNLVWTNSPDDFEFVDSTRNTRSPLQNGGLITITGPTPTPATSTVIISGRLGNCSSPAPTATPPASPTPPTLPGVPNVLMTLTGSSSATTLTDASGNYSFTVAAGGSYIVTPSKGPVAPGTGAIIGPDVLAILRHYLGIVSIPDGCRRLAADPLVDGVINTWDAITVQKFFQGFTSGIGSCGQYRFSPASQSYPSVTTNQTGQDYAMYVLGDTVPAFVNRPGEGSPDTLEENEQSYSSVTSVNLPEITANLSRRNFTVPVTSSMVDANENLVGFQGDFTFDERVVTFATEAAQAAGLTANNWSVAGSVLSGEGPIRTLRISAFSTDFVPLSGIGTLFYLKIAHVNAVGSSPLMWAAPPDDFIFINADLMSQRPGDTALGSVGPTQRR